MAKDKAYMASYRAKKRTAASRADESTQEFHALQCKALEKDMYPDDTYDIYTLKPVQYGSGYQVTFCQIGDDYSAEEYAEKVNEFLDASSDRATSAGKYEGTPEVSFHVSSLEEAVRLAKKYNQKTVWDWENFTTIDTGGTGRR